MSLGEKCSWSSYGFSWMFFNVLVMFLARTKRLGILIQFFVVVYIKSCCMMDDVTFLSTRFFFFEKVIEKLKVYLKICT